MRVDPAEVERRLALFRETAREAGVKLTCQRLEIFRVVASSLDHPDAETVLRAARTRLPTVSLDTVYRTLSMLNDLGLVSTLGPRRESVRFDANLAPHHHYVCVRCGLARDFESADFDAIPVPDAARRFGTFTGARVEIRGLCARCAAAKSNRKPNRGPGRAPRTNPRSR